MAFCFAAPIVGQPTLFTTSKHGVEAYLRRSGNDLLDTAVFEAEAMTVADVD